MLLANLKKTITFLLLLSTVTVWLFSGWPQIWQNPLIPAGVKKVQAAPAAGDGHVIYGDKQTNLTLYNRSFSGTTFGSEGTLSLGGYVGWADLEASPYDADRLLRGVLEQTTFDVKTSIFDYSTGNWTEIATVTTDTGYGLRMLFDIEFEQSTGDALIVYGDNVAGEVKYRTMASSANDWGTEQTLSFGGGSGGVPRTVRAVRDPDTDDIMVAWEDANFDIFSALWDGSSFGSVTTHETNSINAAGVKDSPVFDLAWEGGTSTSEGMITWLNNSGTVRYNTFTSGSWDTAGDVTGLSFTAGNKGGLVITSIRWSGEHSKIAVMGGTGNDKIIKANIWSGSGWGTAEQLTTKQMDIGKANPAAAVWQKTSGDLFVTYLVKRNEIGVRLRIYDVGTDSWSSDLGPLTGTAVFKGGVMADADLNSKAVAIVAGESKTDVGTFGLICADPCNTGAASEWTTTEIDTDAANDKSISADIVFFDGTAAAPPGGATWKEAENTSTTLAIGENVRLRIAVADATGTQATDYDYRLEYASKSGVSCGDDESWITMPITATTEHFEMTTSTYFADGDPTTAQLSNPEGYTFVAGKMVEDPSNSSGNITLPVENYTEIELVFQANANATGSYCFRLTKAGIVLNEYPVYPELEIAP